MLIYIVINATFLATAIINNSCCTYCLVNKKSVQKINLLRIPITLITIEGVNNQASTITAITEFTLDVRGVQQHRVAAYITLSTYNYNIILRKTWLEDVGGVINTKDRVLSIEQYNIAI